jgi:uncharacterized membrane protein YfcA
MELIFLFFIGLFATILGTLAGGGGLISLPAMLLLGIPVHSAIGANKFSNTFSSFSSFLVIYKKKQVTTKEALMIIPISLLGGITGGIIASIISEQWMYWIAVFLLGFAFVTSFLKKGNFAGTDKFNLNKQTIGSLYGIGIYDGVFGPGQGTLMMHFFSYINISYMRAVGLTRVTTFSSCFGAAISYIAAGKLIWPLTFALLLGSLSGAQIGVRLAGIIKKQHISLLLRIVTLALFLQILAKNLLGGF